MKKQEKKKGCRSWDKGFAIVFGLTGVAGLVGVMTGAWWHWMTVATSLVMVVAARADMLSEEE